MNVLWITNIVFPEAAFLLSGRGELKASGGWMLGAAGILSNQEGISLAVAAPSPSVSKLESLSGQRIRYFLFPMGKGNEKRNSSYEQYWRSIKDAFQPDIVHIHGTEFSHGLAYVNSCGADRVVVSIQGLVSVYSMYYYSGISISDIIHNITLRDLLRGTLIRDKERFKKRGEYEIEMLGKIRNVIGRTSWDREHVWAINPNAHYYFCNETLRNDFYSGQWQYDNCVRRSIFISQASYPIKGFHQLLKAMPIVLSHFPDAQVRVAGGILTDCRTVKQTLLLSGYGKYLNRIIRKNDLSDHITFLGPLDSKQMKQEYLRANVFVCPSSIENSPNSLGEAQLLGVPVIAAYVGGIPDMMKNDTDHLYRFDEVEMLAWQICHLFEMGDYDTSSMQIVARKRHSPEDNLQVLLAIYQSVLDEN